jgi:hypothetical protein
MDEEIPTSDSVADILKESEDSIAKQREKGKGKGKDDENVRTIGILFLADGFVVDEEMKQESDSEEEAEEVPASAPAPRRTGMMSLSDLAPSSSKGKGKGKRIPKNLPNLGPLRSYDSPENKQFLDDIKKNLVPVELRKLDAQGEPTPVSISVGDLRPRTYEEFSTVIQQLKQARAEQEAAQKGSSPVASNMFSGAGHSLRGDSSAAPSATSSGAGTGEADPALRTLISGRALPVVDESLPQTTLQLKLATGARHKVQLNLTHTVADIWCIVADKMGHATFNTTSGHELCAGFPPKPLMDVNATLQVADLRNAAVTHRTK